MARRTQERRVRVNLGERSYSIHIGRDSLARAGEPIARATSAHKVAVLTEPGVGRRYAPALLRSLRSAGIQASRIDVPAGDASKSLRQAAKLYDELLERGLDRSCALVALGGGMIGDLTGYVAATYLRGIPFVQVPTTLLAMVDASVGGKVAVNLKQGKNLVGAFHQPRLVWIDSATLRSLPMRERSAGMAELIKHAAIRDARLFGRLEREVGRALALEPGPLHASIAASCRIKAAVVSEDEREQGVRMHLNFGHTLGHAVEKHYGYRRVLHGEAVSMGMVYAARRSEELELAPAGTAQRLAGLLDRAGLPTELPRFAREAYLSALRVDKKKQDRRIRFVVLRRIGAAETRALLPEQVYPARR
jgi:3-dehydroquinate synthase